MEISYEALLEELLAIQKQRNRLSYKNIISSNLKYLGIYSKDLKYLSYKYKDYEFKNFVFNEYYEINFIYAYANLLKNKNDIDKQIDFILNHEEVFESWSIVDSSACLLKDISLENIKKFLKSKNEFIIRFAFVTLLPKVRNEMMINEAFNIIINDKRYYIVMAEAWLLSECLISSFKKSYDLLKVSTISKEIKLIAIQKTLDSFRVNDQNKKILKEYRKFLKGEH